MAPVDLSTVDARISVYEKRYTELKTLQEQAGMGDPALDDCVRRCENLLDGYYALRDTLIRSSNMPRSSSLQWVNDLLRLQHSDIAFGESHCMAMLRR